jgi:hypothetical protein
MGWAGHVTSTLVLLEACNREVVCSYLGRDTGCPDSFHVVLLGLSKQISGVESQLGFKPLGRRDRTGKPIARLGQNILRPPSNVASVRWKRIYSVCSSVHIVAIT